MLRSGKASRGTEIGPEWVDPEVPETGESGREVVVGRLIRSLVERIADPGQRGAVVRVVGCPSEPSVPEKRTACVQRKEVDSPCGAEEELLVTFFGGGALRAEVHREPPYVGRSRAVQRVVDRAGLDLLVRLLLRGAHGHLDPLEAVGPSAVVVRITLEDDSLPRGIGDDVVGACRRDDTQPFRIDRRP